MVGYGDDVIKPSAIAAASVVPLASGLDQTVTLLIVLVLGSAVVYRLVKRGLRAYRGARSAGDPAETTTLCAEDPTTVPAPRDPAPSEPAPSHSVLSDSALTDSTPTEVLPRIEMSETR